MRRIDAEARVKFKGMEDGKDHPSVQRCRRAVFKIKVQAETCDLFYNGRDGYRGRFWQSRAEGERANRLLIDLLRERLFGADGVEHTGEIVRVRRSLEGSSSKIWTWKGGSTRGTVKVATWSAAAKRWPDLEGNVQKARAAVLAPALLVKRAFIDEAGAEHIPPDKVDRSRQLHLAGYS